MKLSFIFYLFIKYDFIFSVQFSFLNVGQWHKTLHDKKERKKKNSHQVIANVLF